MANYSISNSSGTAPQQAMTTTYKTLILTYSTTGLTGPLLEARRVKLYDLTFGTNGTPADNYMEWAVNRATVGSTYVYVGIISSIGQQQLDLADANMATMAAVNSSAENATVTANSAQFYMAANQRASFRWVAAPGSEIVQPATSSAGLLGQARSAAYTDTATMNFYIQEQ